MKKLDSLTRQLVALALRHPKTVVLLAALLTLASLFFIQKIQIRTNLSDLLPDDHPAVVQARELEKVVGGASFIVVAVETENAGAATTFLDGLKSRLEKDRPEGIRYIDDRPPAAFLKKEGLLYLSPEDLDRLTDKIRKKIDQGKLKKARLYVDLEKEEDEKSDDLEEFREKYAAYLTPNPRYQNREGTLFVSLIKPNWRTPDVSKTQIFVERLDAILRDLDPKKYDPSLSVRLTGPYIKAMTQKGILVKDAAVVSLVSFLGAILYLVFHFRRKRAVLLIGVPLTLSTLWTLSLAYFFFGSLNLFSSVACAVLLGLAADYGIHIYSEYHHHRREGEGPEAALQRSISHLGRAFVAASSTTAAAFFALALTRFKALHEFGVLAGCGIILCLAAFAILFPPVTLLFERWRPERRVLAEWTDLQQRFSHLWMRWIFSPRNLTITGLILLLPLLAVAGGRLRFDYNLNHIMGRQETRELDRKVDEIFNHSVNPEVALTASPEDAPKVAAALREVQRRNSKAPEGTTIKAVLSLADFVPNRQEEKLAKIRGIKALFTDLVLKTMSPEERKSYELLKGMLDPKRITLASLPSQIKEKFQDREGKSGRLVFIFPNFEMMQADKFINFVEEVREARCPDCGGPVVASGESTVYYEIVKMLFREGRYVIGFTLLAIFGALLLNFRSLRSALLVFSPLAVGLLATFGWMALTGLPFNIINLAAIPIILGTADDYCVHFYQHYRDQAKGSLSETYRRTFRPILGCALTTLIGFGSLLVAEMGGVRSFGLTCVIGISLCATTTLVWFPAMLAFMKKPVVGATDVSPMPADQPSPIVSFQKVS